MQWIDELVGRGDDIGVGVAAVSSKGFSANARRYAAAKGLDLFTVSPSSCEELARFIFASAPIPFALHRTELRYIGLRPVLAGATPELERVAVQGFRHSGSDVNHGEAFLFDLRTGEPADLDSLIQFAYEFSQANIPDDCEEEFVTYQVCETGNCWLGVATVEGPHRLENLQVGFRLVRESIDMTRSEPLAWSSGGATQAAVTSYAGTGADGTLQRVDWVEADGVMGLVWTSSSEPHE